MKLWIEIVSGAIPASAIILIVLLICRRRQSRQQLIIRPQTSNHFSETSDKSKFHHLISQCPTPSETTFRWDNHPRLITEAAENGWQSFAFYNSTPRSPSSVPLCAFFATCDGETHPNSPESSWELPANSSELMQCIRLNPTPKKSNEEACFSWVRASLPLPGPTLGGGRSFPQEAYFEITIVFLKPPFLSASKSAKNRRDGDKAKLIRDNSIGLSSDSQNSNFAAGRIAVGLTSSANMPIQSMQQTFPGSIGFHSDGSLYLDRKKLVLESETAEWAAVNKVIGCGFEPSKNKVFFTLDSKVYHVIRCNSETYGSPMFPFLMTNVEIKLVVNMGQAPFKYAAANARRTPNPCFFRPVNGEEGGDEKIGSVVDSRELFSVARIETEWKGVSVKKSSSSSEDVVDGDSDLFEIVLQR